MAELVRVSGTRQVTPTGPSIISSPGGNILLESTSTITTGDLTVKENLTVLGDATVKQKLVVSDVSRSNSEIVLKKDQTLNVGNPIGRPYDPTDIYDTKEHRLQGSAYFPGGVGIEKDLNVGGYIYGRITEATTSMKLVITATNVDAVFYPIFTEKLSEFGSTLYGDDTPEPGLTYNPAKGLLTTEQAHIISPTEAVSTDTGALQVVGGVGIGGDLYVDDIVTKIISSINDKLTLRPDPGHSVVEIQGDIRVLGQRPIGTAPVITNVLYVTSDGDDTNDGRAEDPSRACRTIGGAMNSPAYQPGTQILVAAGHYLEDNPLRMKPYTSIRGSDIRTTFIEPINKTQDLFHVDSGCYLNYMTFLNGRSGLLEGEYAAGYNRGAYATAFPPLEGDERIDLFHSPYIQNCTNQSGPWLKDGTMFVPNQTVQIPLAVGIGSWPANTTTIVVSVSTGTIEQGMYINAGQQNPGFFNARTLMLANKQFMQEQVVAYVDDTFNSGSFSYNQAKCSRDVALIVDSISLDLLYNSTSESVFAGIQYWNQGTYTGNIPNEISVTIDAINYAKSVAITYASNAGGSIPAIIVSDRFGDIVNILNTGNTTGITDTIISNSSKSTDVNIIAAYEALIAAKLTIAEQTLLYVNGNYPGYIYEADTCYRDVGYIIDSVAFDLLHGGNKQSIKSGVYYYSYNSESSAVPAEIPQVTAAYNFIKSIIPSIVKSEVIQNPYQLAVSQIANPGIVATVHEATALQNKIDVITNIIRNGPVGVTKEPINQVASTNVGVLNAYSLLLANKEFIRAEVIAYINSQFNNFKYSREFCFRDVGILIENIAYDAAFGGNQKSIESGLAYYDGVVSRIAGQETQTISAIDYLNEMVQTIIVNGTWTNILPVPPEVSPTGTHSQTINTALTDGDVASKSLKHLFNIVTDIISNGPSAAPSSYTSTGPDAAFVSAEVLMQANRTFIQEETVNYINGLVKQFPYNKMKCERDTGLILDSIVLDLLYPTPNRSQSTFAGVQYWNQSSYTGDIPNEINQTLDAFTYLRDLSIKIIQNITPDDDLVERYQNIVPQVTELESATSSEATILRTEFNILLSILKNGNRGWTDQIIPNGSPSTLTGVKNGYKLLQANKEYLIEEVIAYIDTTTPGFNYGGDGNDIKCRREIGFIVDSVSFDLLHGGNRQIVQSGLCYYGINSPTIEIYGQSEQTSAAFNRIKEIIPDIISNNLITTSPGVKQKQVINLPPATSDESFELIFSLTTITNIIEAGPSIAAELTPISLVRSSDINDEYAFNIINANKSFIAEEVVCYVDSIYNPDSFNYNEKFCYRDVGLIVDAVSQDILLGGNQKSIECGLAYWNKGYNLVAGQESTTTVAINYARDIALNIIANKPVSPQNSTVAKQIINPFFQYGGDYMPQQAVRRNFGIITTIIEKGPLYAPPPYAGGGVFALTGLNGADVKISPTVTSVVTGTYDETLCRRDTGYIIDGIYYDAALGTNYNAITCGNAYQRGVSAVVRNDELLQTIKAIEFVKTESSTVMSTSATAVARSNATCDEIIDILRGNNPSPIKFGNPTGVTLTRIAAKDQLVANREFLKAETVAWIQSMIAGEFGDFTGFTYDKNTCARDVGFIVDALCYDILYGGNSATRVCAQAYFSQTGVSQIPGESVQSAAAFAHLSTVAQDVIKGVEVVPTPGTNVTQTILTSVASSTEASTLSNLMLIITNVVIAGNLSSLPAIINPSITWAPSAIQTAVGALGANKSTIIDNTITYVDGLFGSTYVIGLSTSTIGFGNNSTLYFGDVTTFPVQDAEVPEEWAHRKVDPIGSMGGSLVDGAVISERSPIQSFVYDAFTQVTQGGRGVHITNDGYAQLVSVFTIFCSVGVQTDNGGIASIVNSNANFGDICLLSKGYGKRKFSGTVYNPRYKAYPESPGVDGFDQYYPTGFWPNDARVQIFVPDLADRPHISLVMEVIPPATVFDVEGNEVPQRNNQDLPGFLNAAINKSSLSTGTLVLTDVDTTGIAVGNTVYIRDQANSFTGTNGLLYSDTGTVVTNLGYRSVTLSKALTSGGFDPDPVYGGDNNPNWFNIYFCGNAYYTVLSSEVANNPTETGTNILSVSEVTGITVDQVAPHIGALNYLQLLVGYVIDNDSSYSVNYYQTSVPQVVNNLVTGGKDAKTFIDLRFGEIISIIGANTIAEANAVIPEKLRTKSGTVPAGSGSAITLIKNNIEFLVAEVNAFVKAVNPSLPYNDYRCRRDVRITLQRLIYDLETGGRYNSVMVGLSYWSRNGTHHLVQLGENVRDSSLFPDGATVNFYQRSYMSASGYVFEYVGAGTNYGALPQVGRADPVQGKETVQLDSGKVFFTSTDQNGDFRIGPGLVISQATGVLSGRTFTKSLFANMTPFMLAIEGGTQ